LIRCRRCVISRYAARQSGESELAGASGRVRFFVHVADFAIACRQLHKIDHRAKPQQALQVVERCHGAGMLIFRDARTGLARRAIGTDPVIECAIVCARALGVVPAVYAVRFIHF